jgi:L-ascorbate metabolism protein UlaG (beta-lactamase superfamily)
MKEKWLIPIFLVLFFAFARSQGWSAERGQGETVKITPLGARTGEFCSPDRALLFEDPTGVRILYDPGWTVAGSTDPRLGEVHVILLSHVHVDHLGDASLDQDPDAATARCDSGFARVPALPNSNTAEIAAGKNSAVIVAGEVAGFLSRKIQNIRGVPTPGCPASGLTNEMTVPRSSPCTGGLGIGAKRTVAISAGNAGVQIVAVSAQHGNGLSNDFLTEPLKANLAANNLSISVGPAIGYVLTFSNGLTVYLSGDTGQSSDMWTVVNDFHEAKLAVFNIGDIFTTGPEEAAFAVEELIQPKAVIPSHANEVATTDGSVNPGTRTARFLELIKRLPVHVPLSGMTMKFDGHARCVAGCGLRGKP